MDPDRQLKLVPVRPQHRAGKGPSKAIWKHGTDGVQMALEQNHYTPPLGGSIYAKETDGSVWFD